MKARIKTTGKIVRVEYVARNLYGDLDKPGTLYNGSDLDFNLNPPKPTKTSSGLTDQELQQLAREYAEQNPPQGLKDEVLKRNIIGLNAEIFHNYLVWLTSTHDIVERLKGGEK